METESRSLLGKKKESQNLLLERKWRKYSRKELIPTKPMALVKLRCSYLFPVRAQVALAASFGAKMFRSSTLLQSSTPPAVGQRQTLGLPNPKVPAGRLQKCIIWHTKSSLLQVGKFLFILFQLLFVFDRVLLCILNGLELTETCLLRAGIKAHSPSPGRQGQANLWEFQGILGYIARYWLKGGGVGDSGTRDGSVVGTRDGSAVGTREMG